MTTANKTVSSLSDADPKRIDLNEVIQECFGQGAYVKASSTTIKLKIPGHFEVVASHSDSWLRAAEWIFMFSILPISNAMENTLPIGTYGLSFFATLWIGSLIAVAIHNRLHVSFKTRITDQIMRAKQCAVTNEEMMTEAILAFWAIRDSRPYFSSTFRFWHSNKGSNSVSWTMLRPIQEAMRDVAERAVAGRQSNWSRTYHYDRKFEFVEQKLFDSFVTNTEKDPGFETAWFRSVKVPFWWNRLFRNLGCVGSIILLIGVLTK
jgi:hypothetical protein